VLATNQLPANGAALNTRPSLLANRPLARASAAGSGTNTGIKLPTLSTSAASAIAATARSGNTASSWVCPHSNNSAARVRVHRAPMPLATSSTRRRGHWPSRRPSNGNTATFDSCTTKATAAKSISCPCRANDHSPRP